MITNFPTGKTFERSFFFSLKLYEVILLRVMGTWIASTTSSTDAYVLARYGFILNLLIEKEYGLMNSYSHCDINQILSLSLEKLLK